MIELALYHGTSNTSAMTAVLDHLLKFMASEDVQYLKDFTDKDLYHKLKTKAVVELEQLIASLEA